MLITQVSGLQTSWTCRFSRESVKNIAFWPCLVWLSELGIAPRTKKLSVRFPVTAQAWIIGQVLSWGHERDNRLMFLSLSFFLSLLLSLKINKQNLKKKNP